jgi:NTP pyrophosphatase (non-canonical NTP hydrolase)
MWSEGTTKVIEMREAVAAFITERNWARYHRPVNIASAAAVEAAELVELFQWRRPMDEVPEPLVREAGGELADVLHFALSLANAAGGSLDYDSKTLADVLEGESFSGLSPKAAAEEVMIDTSLALIAARSVHGPGGAGASDGTEDGDMTPILVAVELLLAALVRCASLLDLDLALELQEKLEKNRKRFPVGTGPDVGY